MWAIKVLFLMGFFAGCERQSAPDNTPGAQSTPTAPSAPVVEAIVPIPVLPPLLAPVPPQGPPFLPVTFNDDSDDEQDHCEDSDNDGVCDSQDICFGDNSLDTDHDGTPDACDCDITDPTIVQGGPCLDDGNLCTENICDPSGSGQCLTLSTPAMTVCNVQLLGLCDAIDFCDGEGHCLDRKKSVQFQCNNFNTECNPPDYCNGVDNDCPNIYALPGEECGPPLDPENLPCDARNRCDGIGNCLELVKPSTVLCAPGDDSGCNPADYCDGVGKQCPINIAQNGKLCGNPSSGRCDLHDLCSGGVCVDTKRKEGAICERAHGTCAPEAAFCDGINSECPTPDFAPASTACGPLGQGLCDGQGQCSLDHCANGTGVEADVDNDNYSTACDCNDNNASVYPGTECDPPQDPCAPTFCDSATKSCLVENSDANTSCGPPSTMPCLEDPVCDGLGVCQDQVPEPTGTECRPADGSCDVGEFCDGTNLTCPADLVAPSGTICGNETDNHCTSGGQCDGISKICDNIPVVLPDGNTLVSCPTGFSSNNNNCQDGTFVCSAGEEYCMAASFHCTDQRPIYILESDNTNPQDSYGFSVSTYGDFAVVGQPQYISEAIGGRQIGAVFVYRYLTPDSAQPTLFAKIINPGTDPDGDPQAGNETEGFGYSVSIFGNRFAVGAPFADFFYDQNTSDTNCDLGDQNDNAGAVYLFRIDGNNVITEQRVQGPNIGFPADQQNNCLLEPGENDGLSEDSNFGFDVAIGADYLVVGAPHPVDEATGFGYTYFRNGNDWGSATLVPSGLSDPLAQFGYAVAIAPDQTTMTISAPFHDSKGYVAIFKSNGIGGPFGAATSSFVGPDVNDNTGFDVAITNTLLAAGMPGHDQSSGAFAVMSYTNVLGPPVIYLSPDPTVLQQNFGAALSFDRSHLYGHFLIVSGPQYSGDQIAAPRRPGLIAFYSILQSTNMPAAGDFVLLDWGEGDPWTDSDDGQVGTSVAADSNRLVIGSAEKIIRDIFNNENGFQSGVAAFQFYPY
jgi:hypothetical protein